MKITVLKTNLKNGLSAVERAISENSNLPILKNVLLKTFNNKINILTTNLELAITKTISGKIIEDGGLTVPFNTFYRIVNHISQEKINLEQQDNNFIFKTDNYEAKLQGLKEDDFPIIPKVKSEELLKINSVVFKNAINKVVNACQNSEIRPEIGGVLFDYKVTLLKLAATDSFRLAEKTLNSDQFKSSFNYAFKIIVPLKTIQEVIRIFDNDQDLIIKFDSNQILFKNNDLEVVSRLIDGNYPDYEQIIPKSIQTTLSIDKDYFVNAVKLVSAFSGKNNDINLTLKNQKTLEVHLSNQFLGENNYLIPVKVEGPDFEKVAFNWKYLTDGLKAFDSKRLVFGVNNHDKPAIIKSADDASHFYILMPIKV